MGSVPDPGNVSVRPGQHGSGSSDHAKYRKLPQADIFSIDELDPVSVGGGPTDDKPTVTLETPPDPDRVSSFLNIRVAHIQAVYAEWSGRGAQFLTLPKQHETEMRCYIRDPDGYLIEVGQTTDPTGDWSF